VADGPSVLARCEKGDIDLLLLDIRMPGSDGMAVAEELRQRAQPPVVVFVTAYGDKALEAFEREAEDFLLKPVRKERLERTLTRVLALSRVQRLALEGAPEPEQALCVRHRGDLLRIPLSEIYCLQADSKYVTVRHAQGEHLLDDSLKTLEERYAGIFQRIHRNALVNMAYAQGIHKTAEGGHLLELKDCDARLEISRRHLAGLRKRLKE
jgi:two-component system response regulator AlgR